MAGILLIVASVTIVVWKERRERRSGRNIAMMPNSGRKSTR